MTKIHIVGASGSGTSTLGAALSKVLPCEHIDTDDYYWKTKYSEAREVNERVHLLNGDLTKTNDWVLSGSLCGWGDVFIPYFDFVIFLLIPPNIRLERLKHREFQRNGDEILPGGSKYEESQLFLEWASLYDVAGLDVRSKRLHEYWLAQLPCPVLRIEGNHTVEESVASVLNFSSKIR